MALNPQDSRKTTQKIGSYPAGWMTRIVHCRICWAIGIVSRKKRGPQGWEKRRENKFKFGKAGYPFFSAETTMFAWAAPVPSPELAHGGASSSAPPEHVVHLGSGKDILSFIYFYLSDKFVERNSSPPSRHFLLYSFTLFPFAQLQAVPVHGWHKREALSLEPA